MLNCEYLKSLSSKLTSQYKYDWIHLNQTKKVYFDNDSVITVKVYVVVCHLRLKLNITCCRREFVRIMTTIFLPYGSALDKNKSF